MVVLEVSLTDWNRRTKLIFLREVFRVNFSAQPIWMFISLPAVRFQRLSFVLVRFDFFRTSRVSRSYSRESHFTDGLGRRSGVIVGQHTKTWTYRKERNEKKKRIRESQSGSVSEIWVHWTFAMRRRKKTDPREI